MSSDAPAIAAVEDERAAVAAVVGYADALDAHDWRAFRALFSDRVAIDYGAIGSLVATIDADEWTQRCRTLEGFDATAHRLHNLRCLIDGDAAEVTSIVDAAHFVTQNDKVLMGDLIGRYQHRLLRAGNGWLITGVTLTVVGYPAGRPSFDAAFAIARAAAADRMTA